MIYIYRLLCLSSLLGWKLDSASYFLVPGVPPSSCTADVGKDFPWYAQKGGGVPPPVVHFPFFACAFIQEIYSTASPGSGDACILSATSCIDPHLHSHVVPHQHILFIFLPFISLMDCIFWQPSIIIIRCKMNTVIKEVIKALVRHGVYGTCTYTYVGGQ